MADENKGRCATCNKLFPIRSIDPIIPYHRATPGGGSPCDGSKRKPAPGSVSTTPGVDKNRKCSKCHGELIGMKELRAGVCRICERAGMQAETPIREAPKMAGAAETRCTFMPMDRLNPYRGKQCVVVGTFPSGRLKVRFDDGNEKPAEGHELKVVGGMGPSW